MGELSSNTDAKRSVSVSRENLHAGVILSLLSLLCFLLFDNYSSTK